MSEVTTNGFVSVEEFVSQFPVERHGWVYVIHAIGTNRYKIGRSTEPEARLRQLNQKQSPYPLEITEKFWSIDAIADEQGLHRGLADFRVYGEWFEFEDDGGHPGIGSYSIPNTAFVCQFHHSTTKHKISGFLSAWLSTILIAPLTPYSSEILESIEWGLRRVECLEQLLFWARLLDYQIPAHLESCHELSEQEATLALDNYLWGAWDAMFYFSPSRRTGGNNA